MLRTYLTTTVTFILFFPGGLIVYHFETAGLYTKGLFKETHGMFLCILSCVLSLYRGGPLLLLTSIVMRAGFIIHSWPGPLHTSVNTAAPR